MNAIAAIRMMLVNNMGRPLEPSVLIDQLSGSFSARDVRLAFWEGRATGDLAFTDDFRIALPVVGPTGGDR